MSNTTITKRVDVLHVAERMLAGEPGLNALTRIEAVALAGFVIQQNDGETPELVMPTDPFDRALPASLAAAVAQSIAAHNALELAQSVRDAAELSSAPETPDLREDHWAAQETFDRAFNTLKIRFEKEFPNGSA